MCMSSTNLRSSINFTLNNTKPSLLITETVKNTFKGTFERFVVRDNAFSFISSVKGTSVSQIPATTGGFELRISCIQSRYLTH